MARDPEDKRREAEFVAKARAELAEHWEDWKAVDVARWFRKWVKYGEATYDPLCRDLMDVTGVKPKHRKVVPVPDEIKFD